MTAQITGSIEQDVCDFATKLLERRGGLVEWTDREEANAREGTAIVPAKMAALLGPGLLGTDSETIRLSTQPGSKGWCLSLATDFLDTASNLLELEPRVGTFCIPEMYLKQGDFEELVRCEFSWLNARVRLQETRSVRVEYHTWWFHALLVSEDRWETRHHQCSFRNRSENAQFARPLGIGAAPNSQPTDAHHFSTSSASSPTPGSKIGW